MGQKLKFQQQAGLVAALSPASPFVLTSCCTKNKTDRISELPDDILASILTNCTSRDIAFMSSLSRRLEPCVSSIPALSFDLASLLGVQCEYSSDTDSCTAYKDRFIRGVNRFIKLLEHHNNNSNLLTTFGVCFCLGAESTSVVDSWVRFAGTRGVKRLLIQLGCDCSPVNFGTYVFRPQLLLSDDPSSNKQEEESKLAQLSLRSCILGEGLFSKLYALELLDLEAVIVNDEELHSILSCCLNLETLRFRNCELPAKLCISSSSGSSAGGVDQLLRLKYLTVWFCNQIEEMELVAPNLTSFSYGGHLIWFSLLQVPKLTSLTIQEGSRPETGTYFYNLFQNNFPPLQKLSVCTRERWLYLMFMEEKIFSKLKRLELFFTYTSSFNIRELQTIFLTCLVLEQLLLTTKFCKGQTNTPPVIHRSLKKVELRGFCGILEQIEFVKYLLSCTVALQEIIVDLRKPVDVIERRVSSFTGREVVVFADEEEQGRGRKVVDMCPKAERERVRSSLQNFVTKSMVLTIK